jgi:alpha-acetolactate decarboxylase
MKMKKIAFTLALMFLCAGAAGAREAAQSFSVKWYGSFREIIQEKDLGGVVLLRKALSDPHVYAVGMIRDAAGEITVIDGSASLNYGKDGIGNAVAEIRKGEEASLLIAANVAEWRTVSIPGNMTEGELHAFVLEEARKTGINTREPFPFLIDGTIKKLVWSVLDGTEPELTRQTHQLFFRKLVGYRPETQAVLIGFYPAELRSELAWPGEWWHVHVLFKDERTTGHVNAFSVEKGATLRLPARMRPLFTRGEGAAVAALRPKTPQLVYSSLIPR